MIQLFEEDYNLVKRGISIGTDVDSASSPTDGYYDGNVYINIDTLDVFKFDGSVWTKQGNLKGVADIIVSESLVDDGFNTITFVKTDGTQQAFNVKNGSKGSTGVSVTGVVDNGDGTFCLTLSNGTRTANIQTIRGLKGDTGERGQKGETGETGRGLTSITSTDSGKNHILTANFTDGSSNVITTVKDGADGEGAGNMRWETYEAGQSEQTGIVNNARAVTNGTKTLTFNDIDNKATKATSLSGYGITNAYTKDEVDEMFEEVASDWSSVTDKPFDTLGNDFQTKTVGDNKQLALSEGVTTKLQTIDDNVTNGFLQSKNILNSVPSTISQNGVSWTVDDNNHITASGTPSNYSGITINPKFTDFDKTKKYTFSLSGTAVNVAIGLQIFNASGTLLGDINVSTIDFNNYPTASYVSVLVKRASNNVAISVNAYIQMEEGTEATAYVEPNGLSNRQITKELQELTHNETGNATCALSGTFSKKTCTRNGNLVNVSLQVHSTNSKANVTVFNVPTAFRPKTTVSMLGIVVLSNNTTSPCQYDIRPDGNIVCQYGNVDANQFAIYGTYPV